jgi:hypothetical protein
MYIYMYIYIYIYIYTYISVYVYIYIYLFIPVVTLTTVLAPLGVSTDCGWDVRDEVSEPNNDDVYSILINMYVYI